MIVRKRKVCPIRVIAYPTEPSEQDCIKSECEWWDGEDSMGSCAIWTLTKNLEEMIPD